MMPKYFRCNDPTSRCKLCLSKDIVRESEDWKCPLDSPNCADFREKVSLVEGVTGGRSGLLYAVVTGIAILFLVLVIATAGNKYQESLQELRERLASVEISVDKLEKVDRIPVGSQSDLKVSTASFESGVKVFQADLDAAIGDKDEAKLRQLEKTLETLIADGTRLIQSLDRPNAGTGVSVAEGKRLLADIGKLQSEGETFLEEAKSNSTGDVPSFEELMGDIEFLFGRARRLASPRGAVAVGGAVEGLMETIENSLKGLETSKNRLKSFVPAPALQFDLSDAEIRIGANGNLAEVLASPLAAAWSGAQKFDGPDGMFLLNGGSKGRIIVQSLKPKDGFRLLGTGELSVYITDLAPLESELAYYGSGFKPSRSVSEVIALDALTLLVHPENSLETVEIWKPMIAKLAVGDTDSAVRRKAEQFGLNTSELVTGYGENVAMLNRDIIAAGLYHTEGGNLRAKRLAVRASADTLALKPSPFTIATEDYPFSFRIVAWTGRTPSPKSLDFIKHVTSNEGQAVVNECGFVDLRLRPMQGNVEPEILAALGAALGVDRLSSAIRLSTNLRFETASYELDLKALADLERLPRYVADSYANHKVVILGFTDNVGTAEHNRKLSIDRAEVVASRLQASQVDTRATGLGMAFPIATNGTEDGKARNRRAEVWAVKP